MNLMKKKCWMKNSSWSSCAQIHTLLLKYSSKHKNEGSRQNSHFFSFLFCWIVAEILQSNKFSKPFKCALLPFPVFSPLCGRTIACVNMFRMICVWHTHLLIPKFFFNKTMEKLMWAYTFECFIISEEKSHSSRTFNKNKIHPSSMCIYSCQTEKNSLIFYMLTFLILYYTEMIFMLRGNICVCIYIFCMLLPQYISFSLWTLCEMNCSFCSLSSNLTSVHFRKKYHAGLKGKKFASFVETRIKCVYGESQSENYVGFF